MPLLPNKAYISNITIVSTPQGNATAYCSIAVVTSQNEVVFGPSTIFFDAVYLDTMLSLQAKALNQAKVVYEDNLLIPVYLD